MRSTCVARTRNGLASLYRFRYTTLLNTQTELGHVNNISTAVLKPDWTKSFDQVCNPSLQNWSQPCVHALLPPKPTAHHHRGNSILIPCITQDGCVTLRECHAPFEPLEDKGMSGWSPARKSLWLQIEKKMSMGAVNEALMDWISAPSHVHISCSTGTTNHYTSTSPVIIPSSPSFDLLLAAKKFDQHWLELGIRLYSMARQPDQVAAIVKQLRAQDADRHPAFSVFVIQHLNKHNSEDNATEAWTVFTKMLENSGRHPPPFEAYSAIFFSFLSEPGLPYASTVLCLMSKTFRNSPEQSRLIHSNLLRELMTSCKQIQNVDRVSHKLLHRLLDRKSKSAIFNTWLKHSASTADYDHTVSVFELMLKRNTTPQARHVDHLLHSLIKFAGPDRAKQAEELALMMVQRQLATVSGPSNMSQVDTSLALPVFPSALRKNAPPADARTYVHLMAYYAKNNQPHAARRVLKFLTDVSRLHYNDEIKRAILSIHLTMHDPPGAWTFYQSQTFTTERTGCLRTFNILWKALHQHVTTKKTTQMLDFPDARVLFNHMLEDVLACNPPLSPSSTQLPSSLYHRIVHCFCLSEDTPGALLAINAIKHLFGNAPTPDVLVHLLKHFTHRDAWEATDGDKLEFMRLHFAEYAHTNAQILNTIWNRLRKLHSTDSSSASNSSNTTSHNIEECMADDQILLLITAFYKAYVRRNRRLGIRFTRAVERARHEMGLHRFSHLNNLLRDLASLVK